jgi:hypothetical protein
MLTWSPLGDGRASGFQFDQALIKLPVRKKRVWAVAAAVLIATFATPAATQPAETAPCRMQADIFVSVVSGVEVQRAARSTVGYAWRGLELVADCNDPPHPDGVRMFALEWKRASRVHFADYLSTVATLAAHLTGEQPSVLPKLLDRCVQQSRKTADYQVVGSKATITCSVLPDSTLITVHITTDLDDSRR